MLWCGPWPNSLFLRTFRHPNDDGRDTADVNRRIMKPCQEQERSANGLEYIKAIVDTPTASS